RSALHASKPTPRREPFPCEGERNRKSVIPRDGLARWDDRGRDFTSHDSPEFRGDFMSREVRVALLQIVAEKGVVLLDNAKQLIALLRDLCPVQRKEIAALEMVLTRSVINELRSSTGHPFAVVEGRLMERLTDDLPLTEEMARGAVRLIAEALG